MIKKNKKQLIISSIIILLPIVAGLLLWNYLPERIVTHWNANGEPDGFSGRAFAIFVVPVLLFIMHWVCILITARDPRNKDQSPKVFNMVLWIMPITSLITEGTTYAIALGNTIGIDIMVRILLGLMFIVLGNYMPKCKQNHTIGVKVTWALRNEENWNKTHRFTGRIWVLGGVIVLVTMFIPMETYLWAFLIICFALSLAPIFYSYLYYRKQLKLGTATKEDAKATPMEKKMTTISLVIGIVILIIVGIFLFTGEFEVKFNETAFTIDADYWEGATVNYADIDNIEYREKDDPDAEGSRTFGYGSFSLLMGEFENDEFGAYTRYSYISCDSCVVLTVGDKTLVVNGKDEASTKEIYNEISKRIEE